MAAHAPGWAVQVVMRSRERSRRDLRVEWRSEQGQYNQHDPKDRQPEDLPRPGNAEPRLCGRRYCSLRFGRVSLRRLQFHPLASGPGRSLHFRAVPFFLRSRQIVGACYGLAREPHLAVQLRKCTWVAIPRGDERIEIPAGVGIDSSLLELSLRASHGIAGHHLYNPQYRQAAA